LALGQDGQGQGTEKNRAGGGEVKLTKRPGADLVSMARQGPRCQPSAAWGRLHRSDNGGTRSNPTWDASTRACSATNRINSTASPGPPQRGAASIRRRPVMNQVRRRQWVVFPSGISLPISSQRGRATNRLGGDERGSWGEYFAQGGDGEARRGWPERPGGGGGD
jgi:hypothetical protein